MYVCICKTLVACIYDDVWPKALVIGYEKRSA